MRSNFLCPWTFSKFKWWVRWVKKPFSQNFVDASTEPCAEGSDCFPFAAVPGETVCSCVEPFLVQFLWIACWNQFGLLFAAPLDSVPVNARGDWCVTWCVSHEAAATQPDTALDDLLVQHGFSRWLSWIPIRCTMWEKGRNDGLILQSMNIFSFVSVT